MLSLSALARRRMAILSVCGVITLTSCGTDDRFGKLYSVSGAVTYNGQPLEKGEISFVPEDSTKGIGATGVIENGSYTLSTGGNNDGARAGKYKVTVTAREDASAKAKEAFQKAKSGNSKTSATEDPGYIPKQFVTKAQSEAKSLIPAGYGDIRTTTLTAEVKEQTNTIDFKLSDATAPPTPKAVETSRGRKRR